MQLARWCPAERPGCEAFPSHAWLTRLCALVVRDSVWALTWTSDSEQARASATLAPAIANPPGHPARRAHVRSERLRARLLALPAPRAHDTWVAVAPQAPGGAAQRYNPGLTAVRATESLISCREARWFQCSAPRVVRTVVVWCDGRCSATALVLRLLGDSWPCATCCWDFVPGSKRTARLDSIPGGSLACLVWSMSLQEPISCVSAQLPCLSHQRCSMFCSSLRRTC